MRTITRRALVAELVDCEQDLHPGVAMTVPAARPTSRLGLTLLSAFFAFGSLMASMSFLSLLLPGSVLEPIWRLNPQAHVALASMRLSGTVLMLVVAVACALAAVGLWIRALWGYRIALGVLAVNLVGDVMNAVLRGDLRTLIGIPVGGFLLLYILSAHVRAEFPS